MHHTMHDEARFASKSGNEGFNNMKTITVFCSAADLDKRYIEEAKKFAKLMVKNGFDLVWGGSDRGLMKIMASSVQEAGGKIIGITTEMLKESRRRNADEMVIAATLEERKIKLLNKGDAIVLMVGGIGSIDEITHILELKKHKKHEKPIVVLNTNKFYEGFKIQMQRMEKEGFLPRKLNELIHFADTPEEAIKYINNRASTSEGVHAATSQEDLSYIN